MAVPLLGQSVVDDVATKMSGLLANFLLAVIGQPPCGTSIQFNGASSGSPSIACSNTPKLCCKSPPPPQHSPPPPPPPPPPPSPPDEYVVPYFPVQAYPY